MRDTHLKLKSPSNSAAAPFFTVGRKTDSRKQTLIKFEVPGFKGLKIEGRVGVEPTA